VSAGQRNSLFQPSFENVNVCTLQVKPAACFNRALKTLKIGVNGVSLESKSWDTNWAESSCKQSDFVQVTASLLQSFARVESLTRVTQSVVLIHVASLNAHTDNYYFFQFSESGLD